MVGPYHMVRQRATAEWNDEEWSESAGWGQSSGGREQATTRSLAALGSSLATRTTESL